MDRMRKWIPYGEVKSSSLQCLFVMPYGYSRNSTSFSRIYCAFTHIQSHKVSMYEKRPRALTQCLRHSYWSLTDIVLSGHHWSTVEHTSSWGVEDSTQRGWGAVLHNCRDQDHSWWPLCGCTCVGYCSLEESYPPLTNQHPPDHRDWCEVYEWKRNTTPGRGSVLCPRYSIPSWCPRSAPALRCHGESMAGQTRWQL